MVARKAKRNLRGRDAGSGRALGGHREQLDLWSSSQSGQGRTGAGTGPGGLKTFGEKVTLVQAPFSRIAEVVHELGIPGVDGVLADLGVSSMQLDQAARGFSFREAGPLDMRMDAGDEVTADEIVNRWSEKEVADLLYREAEEHDSRRIARAIVRARPIRDTAHLATVVAGARKVWGRQRLHPATKTFLALRIAVNREMEELGQFLSRTPATLNSGGRW